MDAMVNQYKERYLKQIERKKSHKTKKSQPPQHKGPWGRWWHKAVAAKEHEDTAVQPQPEPVKESAHASLQMIANRLMLKKARSITSKQQRDQVVKLAKKFISKAQSIHPAAMRRAVIAQGRERVAKLAKAHAASRQTPPKPKTVKPDAL